MPARKKNQSKKAFKRSLPRGKAGGVQKKIEKKQEVEVVNNTEIKMSSLPKTENNDEKIPGLCTPSSNPFVASLEPRVIPSVNTFTNLTDIARSPPTTKPEAVSSDTVTMGTKEISKDSTADSLGTLSSDQSFKGSSPIEPVLSSRESKPKNNSILTILSHFLVLVAGIVIGGGGMFIFNKQSVQKVADKQPLPTIATKLTPTPTEITLDLGKYKLVVLNGGTTKGEASKLKNYLNTEGFNVVSIGNATSSAFLETIIGAKKSVDQPFLENLETFLSKFYAVSTQIQELEDSTTEDVTITIGNKTSS